MSCLPVATSSNGSECLCNACQIYSTKAELETRGRKPPKSTKQIYLFIGNAGFLGRPDRGEGSDRKEKWDLDGGIGREREGEDMWLN